MTHQEPKHLIRDRYSRFAETHSAASVSCCAIATSTKANCDEVGLYSAAELSSVPEIARALSRGCGNPTSFANLLPGGIVVDFGCGAGIDAILAARKIDTSREVIGVDFPPVMIQRASCAVQEAKLSSEIDLIVADLDHTVLPDEYANVVTSNCVINLCPDKEPVYSEIHRILKPGG